METKRETVLISELPTMRNGPHSKWEPLRRELLELPKGEALIHEPIPARAREAIRAYFRTKETPLHYRDLGNRAALWVIVKNGLPGE